MNLTWMNSYTHIITSHNTNEQYFREISFVLERHYQIAQIIEL